VLASLVGLVWSECAKPVFKDDAADKVDADFKKMRRGKDYTKIQVSFRPFELVEEPSCVNNDQFLLEYSNDGEEFTALDGKAEARPGKYTFTIDVLPCKNYYIKLWVQGEGGSTELQLPNPVQALTDDELKVSGYTPNPPTDITYQVGSEGLSISWTPSECALSYEISYLKVDSEDSPIEKKVAAADGNSVDLSEGLEPCSAYQYWVYAVVGEEYSDEIEGYFNTAPDPSAASLLTPIVEQNVDSLKVTWNTWDKLTCVPKYEVEVCANADECLAQEIVEVNSDLPTVDYTIENLEQCTAYTLSIKPLYEGIDLEPKAIETKTLSPSLEALTGSLGPVQAKELGAQIVQVSWNPVQCAQQYVVYQKTETDDSDWEEVHNAVTTETSMEFAGVPCTAYHYGVRVLIDDEKSDIVEIDAPITTKLDTHEEFVAPNLEITAQPDGAVLTWDHGACINGYKVRACRQDGDEKICEFEEEFEIPSNDHNVSREITGLKPCSPFFVEIFPQIPETEIAPSAKDFSTTSPEPTPPEEYNVNLADDLKTVELNWTSVECATGYKIIQEITDNEVVTKWETDDVNELSTTLQNQEPCVTYRYGIASVVGGLDSAPTEWTEVPVPPRNGEENKPKLEIKLRDTDNDTLTLVVNSDGDNNKCPVESYHLKYNTDEMQIPAEEVAEGEIVLDFPGASGLVVLEARMKYKGFEDWSGWTNNNPPKLEKEEPGSTDLLVPIVIGVLVAVVVIVVVIFFIVKRRKTNQKYDTEKADGTTDETEKLNEVENPKA